MYKSYLINVFVLLCFTVILSACVGTTQIEFDPAQEPEPEQPEAVVIDTTEPPVVEASKPATKPLEIKPYSVDIASTADQLYGTDPGSLTNVEYLKAAEADPTLRYTVIYFDFNKSEVKADAREILSHHARFMQTHPNVVLRLEGHADQRGTSGYNLALGEYRAIEVRTILEAYGVDDARISVVSFGEEQPAVDGNTEEAFKLNRRVELIYL